VVEARARRQSSLAYIPFLLSGRERSPRAGGGTVGESPELLVWSATRRDAARLDRDSGSTAVRAKGRVAPYGAARRVTH